MTSTIWVKILIDRHKPLLIMGGYRQWTIPDYFNIIKSKNINKQMDRWLTILQKWSIALK